MMKIDKTDKRTLKVYTKYAFPTFKSPSILPEIRLKGNWLSKWGYNCGDSVSVTKVGHSILIRHGNKSLPIIKL